MSDQEYLTLLNEWKTKGSYKARNQIVISMLSSVSAIVKGLGVVDNVDDLTSEGILAVINACDTFSPKDGEYFTAYANEQAYDSMIEFISTNYMLSHGRSLISHPIPTCNTEVLQLAQLADVSYNTAQMYATMAHISSIQAHTDVFSLNPTVDEASVLECCEQALKSFRLKRGF